MAIKDFFAKFIGTDSRLPSPMGTQVGGRIAYPNKAGYTANAEHGFNRNPVSAACIGLYASTLNEAPLGVQNDDGTVNINHPLSLLFRKPNKNMGQAEFWQIVWTYLGIGGNAYLKKVRSQMGNIVELVPYSDAFVVPLLDELGWVYAYRYQSGNYVTDWPKDDVIHIQNPAYRDPLKMHMGVSPIEIAWDKINTYNELQATMYSLVASNAVPSGILSAPGDIPVVTVESLKQQLKKRRDAKGRDRTEPLVLGSGMSYTQMGLDSSKLQANEMLQELEVAICGAFRIHPVVALTSAGLARSTYNNIQSAYQEYTTLTRVPFWNALEEQIEAGLYKEYPGIQLQFDLTYVQALQPDADAMIYPVLAEFNANVITLNETRGKLGFEPVEDGDKYSYEVIPAPTFGAFSAEQPERKIAESGDAVENIVKSDNGVRIKWVEAEAVKYYQKQNDIAEEYAKASIKDIDAFIIGAGKQAITKKGVKASAEWVNVEDLVRKYMVSNKAAQEALLQQILELSVTAAGADLTEVQSFVDDIRSTQGQALTAKMTESGDSMKRDISKVIDDNPRATPEELKKLITDKCKTISEGRAATIARTTAKVQTTAVQNQSMKRLNERQTKERRFVNVWLSQRDDVVRESHEDMDGNWVEIGESFSKYQAGFGTGPGTGSAPEENINCRCTLRPVRRDRITTA